MRVSDLRKPLTPRVKLNVLKRQAWCWVCQRRLDGNVVFATAVETPSAWLRGLDRGVYAMHTGCRDMLRRKIGLTTTSQMIVLLRQTNCAVCGDHIAGGRFDHRPPLEQRKINRRGTDFIPPQHDSKFIECIHIDCHQWRTTGRKPGAAKTVTTAGSDVHVAAKLRRATKPKQRRGPKIPSRPFAKGRRKIQSRRFS